MDGGHDVQELSIRAWHAAGDLPRTAALLLQAYGSAIRRFVTARARDAALGDEAYAEFEYDLWRGLPGFRWECPARVWLFMVARRALIRCARRARSRGQREVPLSRPGLQVASALRTETCTAQRTGTKQRIRELWRQLPEADQTLLLLRINRELEWREIACVMSGRVGPDRALEVETARVRKRFQLIKAKLRKLAGADAPD